MTRIKIPECSNPFEVTVNGRKYKYEAGIETDVPDDVAKAIEKHHREHKKEPPEAKAPFKTTEFGEYTELKTALDKKLNYVDWFGGYWDGFETGYPMAGDVYDIALDNDPHILTVTLKDEGNNYEYKHSITGKIYNLIFRSWVVDDIYPFAIFSKDGSTDPVKVVVKKHAKFVKKIDEKYMPDGALVLKNANPKVVLGIASVNDDGIPERYEYLEYSYGSRVIPVGADGKVLDNTTETIAIKIYGAEPQYANRVYNKISFRIYNGSFNAQTTTLTVKIDNYGTIQLPPNLEAKKDIYVVILAYEYFTIVMCRNETDGDISVKYIPGNSNRTINTITIGSESGIIPYGTEIKDLKGSQWLDVSFYK